MQQANGHYQAILDNHAICHWQIWCEVEPRVFRNMANHRGTYFEANSVGWWLVKQRNFYSYFLRIGG